MTVSESQTLRADDVLRDLLTTAEGRANPFPHYRALHELDRFHRNSADGMWYAIGHKTCRTLLLDGRLGHDEERMFRRPGMTPAQLERMRRRMAERRRRGFSMLTENPPAHTRMRSLVSRAFTPRRVEGLRERIERLVDGHLDAMMAAGDADVMADLAFPLPVAVIGDLVGVPESDRERFRPLITDGMFGDGPDATEEDMARAEAAFTELEVFFTDLIASKRAVPGDDLLSDLIAVRDEDDGRLDDDELMSTAFLLFFAGFVTTTNVIGNGLVALLRHPVEMARLWSDPGLAPSAVDEILRYDSPVPFVVRSVLADVEVDDVGVTLTAGDHVVMLVAAANRDPQRFVDPDRFDVGRPDNHPLSFGWGIHHCLGAPLARLEAQIVFERMGDRLASVEMLDPEPPLNNGFLRGRRSLPVRVTGR